MISSWISGTDGGRALFDVLNPRCDAEHHRRVLFNPISITGSPGCAGKHRAGSSPGRRTNMLDGGEGGTLRRVMDSSGLVERLSTVVMIDGFSTVSLRFSGS